MRVAKTGCWSWGLVVLLLAPLAARAVDDFEKEPIQYSDSTPVNAITPSLQSRLESGKAKLSHDSKVGYLRSVVRELNVPVSSQTLVFLKPVCNVSALPRVRRAAPYFSDEVFVGFCQNGDVVEVSAVDPKLWAVFYTLAQKESDKPRFVRQTDSCMLCHASSQTRGVPGHTLRSVYPDRRGNPIFTAGTTRVDQTTPIDKRRGGWYVTGTHGKQSHLGNLVIGTASVRFPVENPDGLNVTDLKSRLVTSAYLSPHSDLVALMVLEHQTEALNLITRRTSMPARLCIMRQLSTRS